MESPSESETYTTLKIINHDPRAAVYHLYLTLPNHNALTPTFFSEFPRALTSLSLNPRAAVIVVSSLNSPHFSSGIDVTSLNSIGASSSDDRGRLGERLRRHIKSLQDAITAIERCRKPVIAAISGACVGGGVDLVTACDLRYCSEDAYFAVKEVDLGIVADLGTLQRLPGIIGYGNAAEMAVTGRRVGAREAKEMGMVSRVFEGKRELEEGVREIAEGIAAKSPLAVTGTKAVLLKSRELTPGQGLDYVATWNSSMLLSDDLKEAVSAFQQKRKPKFAKL
ncbi:hypothetical protein Droror1_Dr00018748 [Drosera rotundifolia]